MKRIVLLFLVVIISKFGYSENVDIQDVIDAGLPVLYVETVDSVEPTHDTVTHPSGQVGYGITNATKVPGRVRIELGDSTIYDSGEYEEKKSGMTIKVRGNTSAYSAKKPYKIKLTKKADLLSRGDDEKYADKNWVLIKDESLKFKIGFKVNELAGLQWTPSYMYVNVVFNGEYRGLYMLLESVERNTKCRLNVDKTGYIFELDAYWWNEDKYFDSSLHSQLNYTYKYPDSGDVTEEQHDYIQGVVKEAEASLKDGTYPNYLDIASFASWMLAHDLLGNIDGGGSNMFYTKYDNTDVSKILMANLWDFDNVMKSSGWDAAHNMFYFGSLFNNVNKSFVRAYKESWNTLKTTFFTDMVNYLDEYASSEEAVAFDKSVLLDNSRWGTSYSTVSSRVEAAKSWFSSRETWLETNIAAINDQEATYSNTLAILNAGKIEISETEYSDGDTFTSTACSDVVMKLIPGANMTLTYLKIDGVDVTADVADNGYTLSHVLGSHAVEARFDRTMVVMGSAYETFCSTADLDFSAVDGIDAYIAKSYDTETGSVTLEKVDIAPAGTGLILVGTVDETYQIPIAASSPEALENLLIGVNEETAITPADGDNTNYMLTAGVDDPDFFQLTETSILAPGKSYLQIPFVSNAAPHISFIFNGDNGEATALKDIRERAVNAGSYYNLAGQRIQHPGKGIYVKNGVKIICR